MSLKSKAINSFSWTVFEMIFSQGIVFLVGIILARILSPEDFGIIGIMTVFIAVANTIVDGGLGSALLRKLDISDKDYNTVFYSNLMIAVFLYLTIFLLSPQIGIFFDIPSLSLILKYSAVILIINAVSLVQSTMLTKALEFKTLAIISIIATIISGTVAITLAYLDYGIWSLVVLTILRPVLRSVFLWWSNNWYPTLVFSKNSFKELFDFGYKVLIARIINTLYRNIYYVVIGKFFSPAALGYYTRAEQFQSPVANNITSAIGKISFPMLSTFQNDNITLKRKFIKFLKFSLFLNASIMATIAAAAEPLILFLIGEKWRTSIYYLQLLCIPGILYPLQIVHLNLLQIKGLSNLLLRIEIIKKIILLPLIIITAYFSIEVMLFGLIIFSIVEFFINSYYTKDLIDYKIKQQLLDILPILGMVVFVFSVTYSASAFNFQPLYLLIIQLSISILSFFIINELIGLNEYMEAKERLKVIIANMKKLIS